jgi:hypothetical protein
MLQFNFNLRALADSMLAVMLLISLSYAVESGSSS